MRKAQPLDVLVKRCIGRETAAQHELYKRFAAPMMAVCTRYARDRAQAEDMLQEGFVKVFQKLDTFNFSGSLEGWIRRIMSNTAIDILRKSRYQFQETGVEAAAAEVVEAHALDNLELEYLFRIIQELPDGYRLVFNMYAIEGYAHKEIGEKLGITESTSRSQFTRARAILMQRIREDRMEPNLYKDAV